MDLQAEGTCGPVPGALPTALHPLPRTAPVSPTALTAPPQPADPTTPGAAVCPAEVVGQSAPSTATLFSRGSLMPPPLQPTGAAGHNPDAFRLATSSLMPPPQTIGPPALTSGPMVLPGSALPLSLSMGMLMMAPITPMPVTPAQALGLPLGAVDRPARQATTPPAIQPPGGAPGGYQIYVDPQTGAFKVLPASADLVSPGAVTPSNVPEGIGGLVTPQAPTPVQPQPSTSDRAWPAFPAIYPVPESTQRAGLNARLPRARSVSRGSRPSASRSPTPGPGSTTSSASKGNSSSFKGVVWHKSNSKWEARIYENGKQRFLGYFSNAVEAAREHDRQAILLHGAHAKLNFPEEGNTLAGEALQRQGSAPSSTNNSEGRSAPGASGDEGGRMRPPNPKNSSEFRGVSWNANCGKWRAQLWLGSSVNHLGYFQDEAEAARAYDVAAVKAKGALASTNFCPSEYGLPKKEILTKSERRKRRSKRASPGALEIAEGQLASPTASLGVSDMDVDGEGSPDDSQFLGVTRDKATGKWLAEIWDDAAGDYLRIGIFDEEQEAARAYDARCLQEHGMNALVNFPVHDYQEPPAVDANDDYEFGPDEDDAAIALASISAEIEMASCRQSSERDAASHGEAHYLPPRATGLKRKVSDRNSPAPSEGTPRVASEALEAEVGGSDPNSTKRRSARLSDADATAAAQLLAQGFSTKPFEREVSIGASPVHSEGTACSLQRRASVARATPAADYPREKSSDYKGVSWHKHSQKWYAYIQSQGKMKGLGYYDDQEEAARKYDAVARKENGPNALVNWDENGTRIIYQNNRGRGSSAINSEVGNASVDESVGGDTPRSCAESPFQWSHAKRARVASGAKSRSRAASVMSSAGSEDGTGGWTNTGQRAAPKKAGAHSRFHGVSWHKHRKMYQVYIHVPQNIAPAYHLGYYEDEVLAARAYDKEILRILGRAAKTTNFPLSDYAEEDIFQEDGTPYPGALDAPKGQWRVNKNTDVDVRYAGMTIEQLAGTELNEIQLLAMCIPRSYVNLILRMRKKKRMVDVEQGLVEGKERANAPLKKRPVMQRVVKSELPPMSQTMEWQPTKAEDFKIQQMTPPPSDMAQNRATPAGVLSPNSAIMTPLIASAVEDVLAGSFGAASPKGSFHATSSQALPGATPIKVRASDDSTRSVQACGAPDAAVPPPKREVFCSIDTRWPEAQAGILEGREVSNAGSNPKSRGWADLGQPKISDFYRTRAAPNFPRPSDEAAPVYASCSNGLTTKPAAPLSGFGHNSMAAGAGQGPSAADRIALAQAVQEGVDVSTILGSKRQSSVPGVTWSKQTRKWQAEVVIDGRIHFVGSSPSEEECIKMLQAAKAQQEIVGVSNPDSRDVPLASPRLGRGPGNMRSPLHISVAGLPVGASPEKGEGGTPRYGGRGRSACTSPRSPRGSSRFKGVSWCEKGKKWRALFWDGTKQKFLGHFSDELEAARVYDRTFIANKGREAAQRDGKLNFPISDYENEDGVLMVAPKDVTTPTSGTPKSADQGRGASASGPRTFASPEPKGVSPGPATVPAVPLGGFPQRVAEEALQLGLATPVMPPPSPVNFSADKLRELALAASPGNHDLRSLLALLIAQPQQHAGLLTPWASPVPILSPPMSAGLGARASPSPALLGTPAQPPLQFAAAASVPAASPSTDPKSASPLPCVTPEGPPQLAPALRGLLAACGVAHGSPPESNRTLSSSPTLAIAPPEQGPIVSAATDIPAVGTDGTAGAPPTATPVAVKVEDGLVGTLPVPAPAHMVRGAQEARGERVGPAGRRSSQYKGVSWSETSLKWRAQCWNGSKVQYIGYYETEEEAARAYDRAILQVRGPSMQTNFPASDYEPGKATTRQNPATDSQAAQQGGPDPGPLGMGEAGNTGVAAVPATVGSPAGGRVVAQRGTSKYKGVSWSERSHKWRAQLWHDTKVHHLGFFEDEAEAARAYDAAVLALRGPSSPTNFPASSIPGARPLVMGGASGGDGAGARTRGGEAPPADADGDHPLGGGGGGPVSPPRVRGSPNSKGSSPYRGVRWHERNLKWEARIFDGIKQVSLGYFDSEQAAARAYDSKAVRLRGTTASVNFPLVVGEHPASVDAPSPGKRRRSLAFPDSPDVTPPGPPPLGVNADSPSGWAVKRPRTGPKGSESPGLPPRSPLDASRFPRMSRFFGVSFDVATQKWWAHFANGAHIRQLGAFNTEEEAAVAHDTEAVRVHGAGARTNFPQRGVSAPRQAPAVPSAGFGTPGRTTRAAAAASGASPQPAAAAAVAAQLSPSTPPALPCLDGKGPVSTPDRKP